MFYILITRLLRIYYKIIYWYSVEGLENLPKSGGYLICPNHKQFNDPLILAAIIKKRLCFFAKAELFKNKILDKFFRSVGCVPVDRSTGSLKSLRICIKLLKDENSLIIFPEGTRRCMHLADVKPGAVMFAIKSEVPIIPVGISRLRPFSKTVVKFGEPIYYNEYYESKLSNDDYKSLVNKLISKIYELVEDKCCYYDEIKGSVENGC